MTEASTFLLRCDCGVTMEPCVSCAEPRCARCEPYVSDDSVVVFAAAS